MEEHTRQELIYMRCGDYFIPDIRLPVETRPIGRFRRMHREYRISFVLMTFAWGVTEELKAIDQTAWVGDMNGIRNRAEEIVLNELIYS